MIGHDVFNQNPYAGHPSLSPVESDVLWEYAKLNQHIKDLVIQTRRLGEKPDADLIHKLRVLERKMGMVFTLFKASAWAVISEREYEAEASNTQPDSIIDTPTR